MDENLPEIPAYDVYWKKKLKSKDISYSRDGNNLLVGSDDGRIYLFNNDGTELWQKNLNSVTCLDLSGDSSKIIVGNYSGLLSVFSKDFNLEWDKKVNGSINSLSISNDGKNICIGTEKGIIIDYNNAGNELWKHKFLGTADGGIFHSQDGKFIVIGSWDTVHLLGVDGKIVWKFKLNKKIVDVSVSENGSFAVACTKSSIGFIGSDGNLISEKANINGFKNASICGNYVYATSLNHIHILNNRGEELSSFETPENLIKISANSREYISALSENKVYVFSSLMRPEVNMLTDSLIIDGKKPLQFELVNNGPKDLEFELELRSKELKPDNFRSNFKVPAKGKSNAEFMVTPIIIGKCHLDFYVKDKKIKSNKSFIEIIPPKVELTISHHSKNNFNAKDDDITVLIDLENKGQAIAKNIRVKDQDIFLIPELKPGSKVSFNYKIRLPSGSHNLSKVICYEDEYGQKFENDCGCEITVVEAPYSWDLKQPPEMVAGKSAVLKFNIKNIKNDVLNLIINIVSEKIKISPSNVSRQLNSQESSDIDFTFQPMISGDNIKFEVIIENDGKKQEYTNEIKVYKSPPHIIIKPHMEKTKYRVGEKICETLELINDGESKAVNIQIEGIENIPELEPNTKISIDVSRPNNEPKHFNTEKKIIKYGGELEEYLAEYNSTAYAVHPSALKIRVPEINLQVNTKKEIKFDIENISNEIMQNVIVELSTKDDMISLEKSEITIDIIGAKTIKPAIFQCNAHKDGEVDYNIRVKHNGAIIEQQSNTIIIGAKIPLLKFEIDDSEMLQNCYSVLKLLITNVGESVAKDINIKLRSEVDNSLSKEATASDYSILEEIKPTERKEINISYKPIISGKVSLTIISSCKSASRKNLPEKKEQVSVTIRPQASEPGTIISVGGDLISGGSVIRDSVLQKSSIGENKNSISGTGEEIKRSINKEGSNSITVRDSIVQSSHIGNKDSYNIKTFRSLCVQALEDGTINKEERDILDNQAQELGLTESEKIKIEEEILKNKSTVNVDIEKYRRQAIALFNKGREPTDSEKGMLDVLRVTCGLTKEQQKQIENEILENYSNKGNSIDNKDRLCPKCRRNMPKDNYCSECGTKLP